MARRRSLVATVLVALSVATVGTIVAPASATLRQGAAAAWKVGDCFAEADVDGDEVDLSSKVPCSKDHAVQVLAGGALPKALADAELDDVLAGGSQRDAVLDVVERTCAPAKVVKALYPKAGNRLAALFDEYDIDDWMIPAAGRMGWVLPDRASWDDGVHDVLCIYEVDDSLTGSSAGDARKISTRDPLADIRLCYKFRPDGSAADFTKCSQVHDVESLFWVRLPVDGKPADVSAWEDGDWESLDAACADFARAVIGAAPPKGMLVRADTDPNQPADDGTRFFNCRIYPESDTTGMAGGAIVTGLGKAKLKTVKLG